MKNEKYILAFRLVWLDMKARRYALAAFASIIVHAIFSLFETLIIAIVAVGLVGNMEVSVAEAPPWLASFIDYGGWLIPLFFIVYSMSYISFGFLHYSVQNLGARIGLLLFEARSRDPNILALQTGNGELINDIGVEITRLSQQVLPPIATCFAKAINIFVLAGYSLYLLPGPTLIAALVFCSAYLAVWLLMKKSTQGLSAKVAMLLNHRMNFLSDYTKGYKFFWASRGHSRVVVRLEQIFKEYASSQARVAFNAYAPKASIEMIAMCLFGFYVFSYNPKVPDSKFFSFYELSQLGAITLKLLPSFSGFFGAFVVMRANSSAWDVFLRNGKSLFEKQTPEIKSTGTVFPIDMQLPKGFEPQKITISDPQIVLFEGASGSGKTSFFDRLIGLRKPQDLINSKALENVIGRNLFAYVPQENFTFEGTIADNLFWDEESDIDYLKSVWVACGLGSLSAGAFDPSLHVYPRKISGGQSQRLAIARALLENKPILILDESFAGIDTESAIKILDATKDQFGHTIFLSSHNSEIKDRADLVVEVRKP